MMKQKHPLFYCQKLHLKRKMETTYASLSVNCKLVYMRLACWAGVTKVGLAMQERRTKMTAELHRESTAKFMQFIDSCDVVLLCQENFQTNCPVTEDIVAIKSAMKKDYASSSGDKKVSKNRLNSILPIIILSYDNI
jgi:hypothetical protein